MADNEFGTRTEQEIRDEALEEAAEICDFIAINALMASSTGIARGIAESIRKLKTNSNA